MPLYHKHKVKVTKYNVFDENFANRMSYQTIDDEMRFGTTKTIHESSTPNVEMAIVSG